MNPSEMGQDMNKEPEIKLKMVSKDTVALIKDPGIFMTKEIFCLDLF